MSATGYQGWLTVTDENALDVLRAFINDARLLDVDAARENLDLDLDACVELIRDLATLEVVE